MRATPDERSSAAPTGRIARVLLILALVYSVALIVAGFLVPVYTGTSASSDGAVEHTSETLVEVNGMNVLLVLAVPLLVTIGVATALRWGTSTRRSLLAWALTAGLAALTLLALMSIGLFLAPVTAALVAANLTTGRGTPRRGNDGAGSVG